MSARLEHAIDLLVEVAEARAAFVISSMPSVYHLEAPQAATLALRLKLAKENVRQAARAEGDR